MIEVFPSSNEQSLNLTELENAVKEKLKTVDQKLFKLDKQIGLKDFKDDFVLENKLFDTLCGLRQQLHTVNMVNK